VLIYLQIDILKFLFNNKEINYFKYKLLKKFYKCKMLFLKLNFSKKSFCF
ncbi:glycosyltransferase family 2 protein, partial [Campylobacter jejuni]|nr:glycosyltransferase family 2 protein [Campylobacter jejuni]